jgi:D-psicose/D-tagatose/L-ribulose 3-epimerase
MAPPRTHPLLAVNTFLWHSPLTSAALAETAPRVADWGYDAIELPLESPGDWDAAAGGELLERLGLLPVICAVMPPGRELVAATPEVVAHTQQYVRDCIDVAVTMGAAHVVGPIYAGVGRTWRMETDERASAMTELREALRPLADYAGQRSVTLGIEPLNRYETSVLNTTEQALDLVAHLPTSLGLALDTYHMNIEEKSLPAALRSAGERLVHLQVGADDRGTPGEDHLDWAGIRSALVDLSYAGVLGIESFTAANKTIATAASIWRPLARTQDAIAIDGVRFLSAWLEGWPAHRGH